MMLLSSYQMMQDSWTSRVWNRVLPSNDQLKAAEDASHEARKACLLNPESYVLQAHNPSDLCALCGRFMLRLERMTSRIAALRAIWTVARARGADDVEIFISTAEQAAPVDQSRDENGCEIVLCIRKVDVFVPPSQFLGIEVFLVDLETGLSARDWQL